MEDVYTLEDKKQFIYNSIESNSSDKVSGEIMNSIKYNNVDFTTNNNGFFINLSLMNPSVIDQIYKIVHSYTIDKYGEPNVSPISNYGMKESEVKDDFKPVSDNLRPTQLEFHIMDMSAEHLTL